MTKTTKTTAKRYLVEIERVSSSEWLTTKWLDGRWFGLARHTTRDAALDALSDWECENLTSRDEVVKRIAA